MKERMKMLRVMAVFTGLALTVTGCGSQEKTPEKESGEEQVTITYESFSPTQETMDRILESFKEAHPEIHVEVKLHANASEYMTSVQTAFASGEGPDVFQFDGPTALGQLNSQMEPLNDYCEKEWGDNWNADFSESAITDNSIDGSVYGLPQPTNPAGTMWYNKTLLDSLGLEVPTNYEELKKTADTLRENGKQPLLIGAKDSWVVIDTFQTILNDFAGDKQYKAYNKELSFTDPDIVSAFKMWQKLFDDGIFQDSAFSMTEYMDTYNQFNDEGIAGMWLNGAWNMDMYTNPEIEENVSSNEWGVTYLPDLNGDGKRPDLLLTSGGYCMNKNSKEKEAAWELVKFMGCDDGAKFECERAMAPSGYLKMEEPQYDLSDNAMENLETITQMMVEQPLQHRGIEDPKVSDAMYEALTKLAYGEITPEEAAAEVDEAIK
ncbi:MAG: extracellular solute-binding protein [Clostridium sp.]|nr:extracellular solute-binding protein [Clostridium sp.]